MPATPDQMKEISDRMAAMRSAVVPRLPGRIYYHRLAGSRCYNLARPESDWDYIGLFVAPTTSIFKLKSVPEAVTQQSDPEDRAKDPSKPDYQFFEVGRFAKLLTSGNFTAVECLYLEPPFCHLSEPRQDRRHHEVTWDQLVTARALFVTAQMLESLAGFVTQQMRLYYRGDKVKAEDTDKWLAHAARLIDTAHYIVDVRYPTPWLEPDRLDKIRRIRDGQVDRDEVAKRIGEDVLALRAKLPGRFQPKVGELGLSMVDEWLVNIRVDELRREGR